MPGLSDTEMEVAGFKRVYDYTCDIMEKWVELKYDNIESCYMISNVGKIKTKSKFIDVYHSTNGFDYVML